LTVTPNPSPATQHPTTKEDPTMTDPMLLFTAVVAAVTGTFDRDRSERRHRSDRNDRGAVSIEQVLWYAAAAISVAVVAAIIWSQIRTTASTPVQSPSAP
jgi:hypothetical protein